MRTLNDQKSLADIFTREENQIEELKYCDKFPENNKLAIAFLEFFLTELYSVRAQKTRSRVLHSLVRESRYLSNQFQGAPKLEMKGNEGRLFLLLKDVSSWDEVTVKSSESVNLWNCSWSLSAQLVKTQSVIHRWNFQNMTKFRRFQKLAKFCWTKIVEFDSINQTLAIVIITYWPSRIKSKWRIEKSSSHAQQKMVQGLDHTLISKTLKKWKLKFFFSGNYGC